MQPIITLGGMLHSHYILIASKSRVPSESLIAGHILTSGGRGGATYPHNVGLGVRGRGTPHTSNFIPHGEGLG